MHFWKHIQVTCYHFDARLVFSPLAQTWWHFKTHILMSTGLTVKSLTNMWWTWEIGTGWKPGEITKPGENLVKFSKPGENLVNFQNLVKTWWIFKTWWKPGDFQNLLKTWWIFKTWWKPGDFQNLVKTWKTSWNPGEFSKLGKNLVNFQNLVKTRWIF